MKFVLKAILTILIVLSSMTTFTVQVFATTYDTTSCDINTSPFTVDQLTNNAGSIEYTSQGCYNNYWDANTKFTELKDGGSTNIVIRYFGANDPNFQSPLRIIKADRAMAYTQNDTYAVGNRTSFVSGGTTYYRAATINIYNDSALTSLYTYIDNNEPLYYYTSEAINPNATVIPSNMNAYVEINGAKGYITLDGIDIIPYIYADANILAPFYYKESTTSSKTLYQRPGRAPGIYISQPKYTTIGTEISLGVDRAITYDSVGVYTKAPSFMSNGTVYYSPDGIRFFSDYALTNQIGTFYNYFNFLSLRTKTSITASQFDTYMTNQNKPTSVMNGQGSTFISAQDSYGMNALLIYAMAIQESGYGTNTYSTTRYNLFSVNAIDSNPDEADYFSSVADSVNTQMGTILRYYMDINSTKFYGSNIGNKGAGFNTKYASDPFWSTKIAKYAYLIDKANGSTEINKFSLGLLKPQVSSTLYKDRNLSTSLYTIPSRAINYPLTLTASYNNTYYTQSTSPIASGTLVTNGTTGLITYDWTNSLAYLSKDQVTLLNTPTTSLAIINDTDILTTYIQTLAWVSNDTFTISGFAALKNTNMANTQVTHTLRVINLENESLSYDYPLNLMSNMSLNLGNGFDYSNAWFEGTVNLANLPNGDYKFNIYTQAGDIYGTGILANSLDTAPKLAIQNVNGTNSSYTYAFRFNNKQKMRYELTKEAGVDTIARSSLLPSQITSISSFTNIQMTEDDIFTLIGYGYIIGTNMGINDSVSHKLLIISENNQQYFYDLPSISVQDMSMYGFDYSNVWFENRQVDLSNLPSGTYRLYILTQNSSYLDLVRLIDVNSRGNQTFTTSTLKTFTFKVNAFLRNTYYLVVN